MPRYPDFGTAFARYVAGYLEEQGLKTLGSIDRARLALLAQGFLDTYKPPSIPKATPVLPETDDQWLLGVAANPAYQGLDVRREVEKCRAWASVNGKKPSRRRIVNWLNKATDNLPITSKVNGAAEQMASRTDRLYTEPEGNGWLAWRAKIFQGVDFDSDRWGDMSLSVKAEILKRLG